MVIEFDFDKVFDIAVYVTAFSVVVLVGLVVTSLFVSLFTCLQPIPNEYGQLDSQSDSGNGSKPNFKRKMLIPNPDYNVWIKNYTFFRWFSDFGVWLVIEGLIWLLEIFNFIFNPSEIYPIMIQSVFLCRDLSKFCQLFKKRYVQYYCKTDFVDSSDCEKLLVWWWREFWYKRLNISCWSLFTILFSNDKHFTAHE